MKWKNEIKEIFELATLHSWCSQVNEMIADFNKNYTINNSIISYLVSILNENNLPNEYYILSLVLLNYQEYPTEDIIELAITSLYSKLNKNDILFFKEHLFFGNFPLSSDLSEDITNRSFLSPKVAIKKAMEIDSVISKNNPIITVLYMNFILSRMDMNEENRAMVAFLLLRVDIDLPKSLNDRVYKYLLEYKDVIQELLQEENGEIIKIDDIASIKEKITKIEIIEKKNVPDKEELSPGIDETHEIKEKAEQNKTILTTKLDNIEKMNFSIPKQTNSKIDNNSEIEITKNKEKTYIKNTKNYLEENKLTEQKLVEALILKKKKLIKKTNIKTNIKTNETSNNEVEKSPSKIKNIIYNKDSAIIPAAKNTVIKNVLNNENIDISEDTISKDKISDDSKKSWQIALKENKYILESILTGIGNIGSGKIFSGKNRIINNKNKESNSKVSGIKDKAVIYSIVFFVLLSLILIPLLINKQKKTEEGSLSGSLNQTDGLIQKSVVNEPDSLNGEVAISQSDLGEPGTSNSNQVFESLDISIPDNFPVNIIIIENNIFWKVLEGESITGLFFTLQENKQSFENTKLEKLTNLSWDDFFTTFKDNNPIRDSYHIIFPEEEFILPLN